MVFEQGLGCSGWRAFALLPVTNGVDRHINPIGKLRLAQTQALAHSPRELGRVYQCRRFIVVLLDGNIGFSGGIQPIGMKELEALAIRFVRFWR